MLLFSFKLSNIGSMESTINVGSQPWHGTLPSNWVPIVSRDVTRQQNDRDNGSRPPSDALLSTQSAKRRRLASKSKPEGNVEQLIADTLHSAIRVSGAQPVHAVEEVVQETSRHDAVQQSLNQDIQRTSFGDVWCKRCLDVCKYTTIAFPICYAGCMFAIMGDGHSWSKSCDT